MPLILFPRASSTAALSWAASPDVVLYIVGGLSLEAACSADSGFNAAAEAAANRNTNSVSARPFQCCNLPGFSISKSASVAISLPPHPPVPT